MENEFMKRGYLLPDGCKDLAEATKLKEKQRLYVKSLPFLKSFTPKTPIKGVLTIPKETTVQQLAAMLGQKPYQIVGDLMTLGKFLNEELNFETISKIALKYGFLTKRAGE